MADRVLCPHCGEEQSENAFDDGQLVCRACEARGQIRRRTKAIQPTPAENERGDA